MEKKSIFNDIIKPALVLATVALIIGAALVVVYNITKKPEGYIDEEVIIAAQTVLDSEVTNIEADLEQFKDYNVEAVLKANDNDNYAVYLWTKGYGGELKMIVGVDKDLKVIGTEITSMLETAGLGDKTKDPTFQSQYIGKTKGIEAVKSGTASADNQIDAISGATISSKAVTTNVNNALEVVEKIMSEVSE